jgi:(p)ppGpp synthase/HD superfamily hydrolase
VTLPASPSPRVRAAWTFARRAHEGQVREADGAPFVAHPLEVAVLLDAAGAAEAVVAAGLLHDVVEHGGASVAELEAAFGAAVAGLVADVTEDPGLSDYVVRKGALRTQVDACGDDAVLLFGADKVAKTRELRAHAAADGLDSRRAACRHAHYAASLAIVQRRLPDHPVTALLGLELLELAMLPVLSWLPARAPACGVA